MATEFIENTSYDHLIALLDGLALYVYMHKYVFIQVIFTIPGSYLVFIDP